MDAFAEALRTNQTPRTPGEEGLQDMRIIEAICQAVETGGVVTMPAQDRLGITRGPAPSLPG